MYLCISYETIETRELPSKNHVQGNSHKLKDIPKYWLVQLQDFNKKEVELIV